MDLNSTADHLGFNGSAHAARRDTHRFPFTLVQPWFEQIVFQSCVASRRHTATSRASPGSPAVGPLIPLAAASTQAPRR
ncbi:MAG: hypothetical protein ACXVXY_03825 [Mycobacteriaceae bacterium]